MSKQFNFKQFTLAYVCNLNTHFHINTVNFKKFSWERVGSLNTQTVLFQTIQFSISTHFSSIWSIDRILSGATNAGQSGPGSDSNETVHCIPQNSSITGVSLFYCFVSYREHSLGKCYLSAEKHLVYSTSPADWVTGHSLGKSYPSAEKQSVYSTTPVARANTTWQTSNNHDVTNHIE